MPSIRDTEDMLSAPSPNKGQIKELSIAVIVIIYGRLLRQSFFVDSSNESFQQYDKQSIHHDFNELRNKTLRETYISLFNSIRKISIFVSEIVFLIFSIYEDSIYRRRKHGRRHR